MRRFLPLALWAALLLGLGSQPSHRFPRAADLPALDKAAHALLYAPLGFLGARAFGGSVVLGVAACVACGALDEWNQRTVPGRAADWRDVAAGAAGGTLGGWILVRTRRRRARSRD